jgi:hypothetical protein
VICALSAAAMLLLPRGRRAPEPAPAEEPAAGTVLSLAE